MAQRNLGDRALGRAQKSGNSSDIFLDLPRINLVFSPNSSFMRGRERDSMERRTQLSIILINTPGELAKLCEVLSTSNINILAMNIQNAKDAVRELFKIRERTRRRIALAESYRGILKDSSDYSIIRIVVDKPEKAQKRLTELEYLLDSEPVLVFTLTNKPGMLGEVAKRLGEAGININYTYGSVMEDVEKSIFIIQVSEIEKAEQFFTQP